MEGGALPDVGGIADNAVEGSKEALGYLEEYWEICKIVSQAISCYLSNSLLFTTVLPRNNGPDKMTVFLGKAFQIGAAALFVLASAQYGLMLSFGGLIVAILLPFTQDIRISLPGFSSSATLFLPTAAMLSSIVPYDVALFALTYFTFSSLGGLAPSLLQGNATTAAMTAAKKGRLRAAELDTEEKKKQTKAKIQSLESEISNQETRVTKAKAAFEEASANDAKTLKKAYEKAEKTLESLKSQYEKLSDEVDNLKAEVDESAPTVNLLNHPLLPYQLALVPLFIFGNGTLGMIKKTMCTSIVEEETGEVIGCNITTAGLLSLSVTLSIFSVALVVGLYFGVSSYSLMFSLPHPDYNGGKWTPFRGGMTKVTQEIALNIVNMNLLYWVIYFVAESSWGKPLRSVFFFVVDETTESVIGDSTNYQMTEEEATKERIEDVKKHEETVLRSDSDESKAFIPYAILITVIILIALAIKVGNDIQIGKEIQALFGSKKFQEEIDRVKDFGKKKDKKKKKDKASKKAD